LKSEPNLETIAKKLYQLYVDYYDSQIFNKNVDYELTAWAEMLEADPSASFTQKIDHTIFFRELEALNIELFGLAWFDYNYKLQEEGKQDSSKFDVALFTEIMFAKSYLEQTKGSDIWNAAGFYNENILQATMAQHNLRDWAIPRDIPSYYKRGVNSFDEESQKLLLEAAREHCDKLLSDKECASRLANRIVSNHTWQHGIMIPQKLSSAFAQRLNFSPNIEALLLLQRLIVGIYNNARHYIDAVMDYGSWELARKESENFMKHIIGVAKKEIEKKNKSEN
jgi:hypothetical protein